MRTLSLLLAAVVLLGCGTPPDEDLAALEERVAAADTFREDVDARLTDIEEALAALQADDGDDGLQTDLDNLRARLADLDDELATLDGRLGQETQLRTEGLEDAETAASDLRQTLDGVRGTLDEVQTEVEELRVLYETLRDRLDEHQRRGHG